MASSKRYKIVPTTVKINKQLAIASEEEIFESSLYGHSRCLPKTMIIVISQIKRLHRNLAHAITFEHAEDVRERIGHVNVKYFRVTKIVRVATKGAN